MKRVKVFDCGSAAALEESVNEFLESIETNPQFELVDIKFNNYAYGENHMDYHTALIIYNI